MLLLLYLAECKLSSFLHFFVICTLQLLDIITIDWIADKDLAIE